LSLLLLIGGVRSGKSSHAVSHAMRTGRAVTFIATAEAFDDDMRTRIDHHRAERPADWTVVEVPVELGTAIAAADDDHVVIVDCLTVWLANLFHHLPADSDRRQQIDDMAGALRARAGRTIVITNEVGMGLHPDTELGRRYRDELGRVNQLVAAAADDVWMMVAGRAMRLTPVESLG
jgi:adenosylcobinamide kinase / adenosylcobinamide-phosphate guanylyltransferase